MKITMAYQYLFGSLLHSGDTTLTSRARSSCQFYRPEVKVFDTRFLESTDVNGNFDRLADPEPQIYEDTRIFAT